MSRRLNDDWPESIADQEVAHLPSTFTEFDKKLDDILLRHGAEQGELHHSLKKAIKEAVDTHIIGNDVAALDGIATDQSQTGVLMHNAVKRDLRSALWGTS